MSVASMSVASMSVAALPAASTFDVAYSGFCQREACKTLKLGEILQLRNVVTSEQLQNALDIQRLNGTKSKLGEILMAQNLISPLDLQKGLMEQAWRKHGFWVID
ncbi:MAG: hypothetical protein AAF152_02370 [Cyanobacteria bacterium P01_A01_bin.114]